MLICNKVSAECSKYPCPHQNPHLVIHIDDFSVMPVSCVDAESDENMCYWQDDDNPFKCHCVEEQ